MRRLSIENVISRIWRGANSLLTPCHESRDFVQVALMPALARHELMEGQHPKKNEQTWAKKYERV